MTSGWEFFCDRLKQPNLDLYPILFEVPHFSGPLSLELLTRVDPHRRYALSGLEKLSPFIQHWFTPSSEVQILSKLFESKYHLVSNKTIAVVYRGTDKHTEVQLSSVHNYIKLTRQLLAKYSDHRVLIQTDQLQVRDLFLSEFGERCFSFQEMPVSAGNSAVHSLSEVELGMSKLEFSKTFLAVSLLLSKCHLLVNHTGNTGLWLCLYRGSTKNMYQFDENAHCSDPRGRDFTRNPLKKMLRSTKDLFGF